MPEHSQPAQAAGYSDWLAADEAALDYIATRIAPKLGILVGCSRKSTHLPAQLPGLNLGSIEFKETKESQIKTDSIARRITRLPYQRQRRPSRTKVH